MPSRTRQKAPPSYSFTIHNLRSLLNEEEHELQPSCLLLILSKSRDRRQKMVVRMVDLPSIEDSNPSGSWWRLEFLNWTIDRFAWFHWFIHNGYLCYLVLIDAIAKSIADYDDDDTLRTKITTRETKVANYCASVVLCYFVARYATSTKRMRTYHVGCVSCNAAMPLVVELLFYWKSIQVASRGEMNSC